VDALNAVEKNFFLSKLVRTATPGVDSDELAQRLVVPHAMVEKKEFSLAKEAHRILSDPKRKDGVKSHIKYRKREELSKLTGRHFHVEGSLDDSETLTGITGNQLGMHFTKIKHQLYIIQPDGVATKPVGDHAGIMGHYNIRTDPDLGVNFAAMRYVPCACEACVKQLKLPWNEKLEKHKQPRYAENRECARWVYFTGLNNWKIVELRSDAKSDESEEEDAYQLILDDLGFFASGEIKLGGYGAVAVQDGENGIDYYVVKWTGLPYAASESIVLEDKSRVEAGELLCTAMFLNKVPGTKYWYTHPVDRAGNVDIDGSRTETATTVRMRQTMAANLDVAPMSDAHNPPPRGFKTGRKAADLASKQPVKLSSASHEAIIWENVRRERLAYDEDCCSESEADEADEDLVEDSEADGEED